MVSLLGLLPPGRSAPPAPSEPTSPLLGLPWKSLRLPGASQRTKRLLPNGRRAFTRGLADAPAGPEGHPRGSRPRPEGPRDKLVAFGILRLLLRSNSVAGARSGGAWRGGPGSGRSGERCAVAASPLLLRVAAPRALRAAGGASGCTEPRGAAAGSPSWSPPPPPPVHTCVRTRAKMEGTILTSAASRWEGREPRGIPLAVWESEPHLPLTCGGSTLPTPSGGHSQRGVAARNREPSGPGSKGAELGGQRTPPGHWGKCFAVSRVARVPPGRGEHAGSRTSGPRRGVARPSGARALLPRLRTRRRRRVPKG